MSDNITKKVLVDVDLKTTGQTQAVKAIAELKEQVVGIKRLQEDLNLKTEEGRKQNAAYDQQIKALNTTSQTYQKQIQSSIKAQNEQKDSIQALKAQLSLQTAEYNKMGAAQRNTSDGKALAASVKAISDELKKLEGTLGNNTRSIGDYALANKKLPGIFGEMQASATAAYKSINDNLAQGKQMIAEYIAAKEVEKLAQTEAALAAQLAARAEAELAASEAAGTATAAQAAAAESARAAATATATVATEAGTTAMKIFKIALASTGIGLLVVALGAVVTYFTSTNEGAKKFQQIMNGINAVVQSGLKILGSYGKLLFAIATFDLDKIKEGWKELGENIKNATGNIAENYKAAEQNTKNQQMMAKREREWSGERLKLLKEYEDAKIMASKRSSLDDAGKEAAAKKALKINELIYQNDLKIAQNKAKMVEDEQKLVSKKDYQAIQDSKNKVQEIINTHSQQQLTVGNLLGKTEQRIDASNKAEVKSNQSKLDAKLEAEIKSDKAILVSKIIVQGKLDEMRLDDDVYYQQRLGYINSNYEAEKAIIEKSVKNEDEAAAQITAIQKTRDEQLANLNSKKLDLVISNLEYETELSALKLEEMLANKIRTDEEMHLDELLRIQRDVDAQIKAQDLRLESDKSYQAEHDKQIALIRQKGNVAIAQEDAAFEQKQKDLKDARIKTNLNNELELAKGNINAEHDIKLKQLKLDYDAEIANAIKTKADLSLIDKKYAKFEEDLAEETRRKKLEKAKNTADQIAEGMSALNDLLNALGERELQDYELKNKIKKSDLDTQLKAGLISQQQHDYQVAVSEHELDKKRDKLAREAAIRGKALAVVNAIINGTLGVLMALGQGGPILAIAAGVVAAAGIATIIATPLPSPTASVTMPKFDDFAVSGSGSSGGGGSSGGSGVDNTQKELEKASETAQKLAEKAQEEYEKAQANADKAIQDARDLAEKIAQQERDRADKEVQAAWEKSDKAIAEASARAEQISKDAQAALSNALSNLEKAQSAVLSIQEKIDKKASDKLAAIEKEKQAAQEASDKALFDIKADADRAAQDAQEKADRAEQEAKDKLDKYNQALSDYQNAQMTSSQLQSVANSASSDYMSQKGMLWYQPEAKAALRKVAEDAQKAADKAKADEEKAREKAEQAKIDAENAKIASEQAIIVAENAKKAQTAASDAALQASLAADERAKQAAESAKAASAAEDAAWQRELEAAKQAEIIAQQQVEQAKLDAEQAKIDAELAAQKKLDAELAAEARKQAYDEAQAEKTRLANEAAQTKANETALAAQKAANDAALAAAQASAAAALALAAATKSLNPTTTTTATTTTGLEFLSDPTTFRNDGGYTTRNGQDKGLTKEEVKQVMKEAVSEVKVYAAIEDIRREDKKYTTIEAGGDL